MFGLLFWVLIKLPVVDWSILNFTAKSNSLLKSWSVFHSLLLHHYLSQRYFYCSCKNACNFFWVFLCMLFCLGICFCFFTMLHFVKDKNTWTLRSVLHQSTMMGWQHFILVDCPGWKENSASSIHSSYNIGVLKYRNETIFQYYVTPVSPLEINGAWMRLRIFHQGPVSSWNNILEEDFYLWIVLE